MEEVINCKDCNWSAHYVQTLGSVHQKYHEYKCEKCGKLIVVREVF